LHSPAKFLGPNCPAAYQSPSPVVFSEGVHSIGWFPRSCRRRQGTP